MTKLTSRLDCIYTHEAQSLRVVLSFEEVFILHQTAFGQKINGGDFMKTKRYTARVLV